MHSSRAAAFLALVAIYVLLFPLLHSLFSTRTVLVLEELAAALCTARQLLACLFVKRRDRIVNIHLRGMIMPRPQQLQTPSYSVLWQG